MTITSRIQTRNAPSLITEESHITIHSFMRTEMDLKNTELLVFALIYGFFQNGLPFTGSRQYIADWVGGGLSTVDLAISSLIRKGYLEKIQRRAKCVQYAIRVENLPSIPMHRGMLKLCAEDKAAEAKRAARA